MSLYDLNAVHAQRRARPSRRPTHPVLAQARAAQSTSSDGSRPALDGVSPYDLVGLHTVLRAQRAGRRVR